MGVKLGFVGSALNSIKHYTNFYNKVWIDNFVFRLHSRVTVLILFASCIIVSMGQFFGDPIDCLVDKEIPSGVMDTYCWIHGTFTLPKLVMEKIGSVVPHPGLGPVAEDLYEEETVTHKFYQWVAFTLYFQGLCFLLPYTLWKRWEEGKLSRIIPIEDLKHQHKSKHLAPDSVRTWFTTSYKLVDQKKINLAVGRMKDYFITRNGFQAPSRYMMKFTICEVLNFLNVILQIVFLDVFFDGVFTTYGSDVLAMSEEDPSLRKDPLNSVFPKVAKCTFNKFGPSGTIEKFDGLCILSLNIINEKIYVLLWFWFVFLSTVSAIQLIWRILSITSRRTREFILRRQTLEYAQQEHVAICCAKLSMGDWFILQQVGENVDVHVFADLVKQVGTALKKIHDIPVDTYRMTEL